MVWSAKIGADFSGGWDDKCEPRIAAAEKKRKRGNLDKGKSWWFLRGEGVQNEGKFLQEPATTKKRQNIVSNTNGIFSLNPINLS